MGTTKKFTLNRLKSLVEYNMRKMRIKGFEYTETFGTRTDGKQFLKNDSNLRSWDNSEIPIEIQDVDENGNKIYRYGLYDNNVNMRDLIAKTIYDILSGSETGDTIDYTSSLDTNYLSNPSAGSNEENGNGFYLEVSDTDTITFTINGHKIELNSTGVIIQTSGNHEITLDDTDIQITSANDTNEIKINDTSIYINTIDLVDFINNHTHDYEDDNGVTVDTKTTDIPN